jgi:hypothetical protein
MAEQHSAGDAAPACGRPRVAKVSAPSATIAPDAPAVGQVETWLAPLLFAVGFAWIFRGWLFNGFDGAFGDEADGYLALAIIEHWRHVFAGTAYWSDPKFFYPERGTLGYTDALFLIGTVHAVFRALGADVFTAYMLAMSVLAIVGYFGFLRLAVRHFAISPAAAAVGAFLFAFANVDAVKLVHVQAYCAMLLPLLCDLVLSAWQSVKHRRGVVLSVAAGLLYAALFLTAFQTAWFFGCYLLLLTLLHPLVFGRAQSRVLFGEILVTRRYVLLGFLAGFTAGIVPFMSLYLPVFLSGRNREFAEVVSSMPDWRDLLNVTPENAVWGHILKWLGIVGEPSRAVSELELAFTPAVLIVFALGLVMLRSSAWQDAGNRWFVVLGAAVIVGWLLQMDYGGVRPWQAVWAFVPGAGAVRYTFRSQVIANLFVALVVARTLMELGRTRVAAVPLAAFLIVEQANLLWTPVMSRQAGLAWINAVPPPPAGCRVFYLVPNAFPVEKEGFEHQDNAMLFAVVRGIPTINGYSSWFPDGWDLEEPARPGYAAAVHKWARSKRVDGLCGLDPRLARWTIGLPE